MERVGERNMADAMAQPFFFPGGEHGVLLIHGFTGSSSHMRLLGEHLHAVGFTVRGINLPDMAAAWRTWANIPGRTGCRRPKWRWRRCRSNAAM